MQVVKCELSEEDMRALSSLDCRVQVVKWELSEEDMRALSSLKTQMRMLDGSMFTDPGGPYKTPSDIWDNDSVPDKK